MANIPQKSSTGLNSLTSNPTSVESDAWYRSDEGRVRVDVGSNNAIVGPHGSHPLIHNVSNCWYPLQNAGGVHSAVAVTNNRAYAYPLYPGKKCTLAGAAMRISVLGGVGNLRIGLYGADSSTGFPGTLVADYGTQSAVTVGAATISGWSVSTALEPVPYWFVFVPQTSVAPTMSRYTTFNTMVPWPVSTPSMGAADFFNSVYSDTGFGGSLPGTFGAVAGIEFAPFVYVKINA